MEQFPSNLIERYQLAVNKLKKFQRVVFKRFAPNVSDVCTEFNQIAIDFNNSYLPQYAGLSWIAASKCEKALGNTLAEVDYLLKAARAFRQANQQNVIRLKLKSYPHEHLEGAIKCYNKAIGKLDDDSVMKAAIIRELKKINPMCEITSSFVSPSHRIYDLEQSAKENIESFDYVSALDKLTEIYDDIMERNQQQLYGHVLIRNEITRILLLLLLQLPPSRQSPSNIKLMERYSLSTSTVITSPTTPVVSKTPPSKQPSTTSISPFPSSSSSSTHTSIYDQIPYELNITIKGLVSACQKNDDKNNIIEMINQLKQFYNSILTDEQQMLINELINKYYNT